MMASTLSCEPQACSFWRACCLAILLTLWADAASPAPLRTVPICSYKVINTYPHDRTAFTQGLIFRDNVLYESTGRYGRSSIRKARLETGEIIQRMDLPDSVFSEGLTAWQDHLINITWTSGVGFIINAADLKPQRIFRYDGEGWGLTHSPQEILMSDGTSQIRVLDPIALRELRRIDVTAEGTPVLQLNELEWVQGEIYANIWKSDYIARIDPRSGNVQSWIDLSGLLEGYAANSGSEAVLNGIAYDEARSRLFVTGKLWPKLFEIELIGSAECHPGSKSR